MKHRNVKIICLMSVCLLLAAIAVPSASLATSTLDFSIQEGGSSNPAGVYQVAAASPIHSGSQAFSEASLLISPKTVTLSGNIDAPNVAFTVTGNITDVQVGFSNGTISMTAGLGDVTSTGLAGYYGLASDSFTGSLTVSFNLNSGVATKNLHLEHTPAPVPTAAWLLGTGLVGLLGIRRRIMRKK